ncbi:putative small nuclear ribonucleoprotein [Trichinella spiralis]|uniref:Small nuclear ribonucleoprotein n=1 Tax=Trichinella spiralis TaxID=6334 RepID=A0ABR3KRM7_TRISP
MEEISQKDVRRLLQQSYATKKAKAELKKSALKPYFICMIGKKIVVELNENSSAIGNLQHFDNDMNLICKDGLKNPIYLSRRRRLCTSDTKQRRSNEVKVSQLQTFPEATFG